MQLTQLSLQLDGLEALVAPPQPVLPDPGLWDAWPTLRVLSYDQGMAASGWVALEGPKVIEFGIVKTKRDPAVRGFHGSFTRGQQLYRAFAELRARLAPDVVLYELPAANGRLPASVRESAAVAAMALWCANDGLPVVAVQAQRTMALLTGLADADKAQVHAAIEALGVVVMPQDSKWKGAATFHHSDALGNAMAWVATGAPGATR